MSPKQKIVFDSVKKLYTSTTRPIAKWLWQNHIQWVADKSIELAQKYGADADCVYAGALLHDIADVWLKREDVSFDQKCDRVSRQILKESGFSEGESDFILQEIIKPHSCHTDQPLPTTWEGKILATADGLAHLMTDFYVEFKKMGVPSADTVVFNNWVREKIERDFHKKLFFEDEKQLASANYHKLRVYFTET